MQVEEQAGPRELIVFNTDELIAMDPGIRAPGGQNQSDELVPGSNLALYGRGDHLQEAPLTLVERQQMVLRLANCNSSQRPQHVSISHHVLLQVCVRSLSRQCEAACNAVNDSSRHPVDLLFYGLKCATCRQQQRAGSASSGTCGKFWPVQGRLSAGCLPSVPDTGAAAAAFVTELRPQATAGRSHCD